MMCSTGRSSLTVLSAMTDLMDREVYTEPEAARLLEVPPSTLHYWLHGGVRGNVTHKPIIRPEAIDGRYVTWAEFIEAGWLRAYRSNKIPMKELRAFIEVLRDEFQVPYPLAHRRPLVSGRAWCSRLRRRWTSLSTSRLIDQDGMLTYPGQSFVDRVTWKGDLAEARRPVEDPASTVLVQPDVRFGRPAVGGVSTITIYEYAEEGASRG